MTDREWLLAIDIGNTQVLVGVLEGDEVRAQYRLTSRVGRTADELLSLLEPLLGPFVASIRKSRRVVIASVVPTLTVAYERYSVRHLGVRPLIVTADLPFGLKMGVPDPTSVGADRIANAIAVAELYRLPAIVVDLGTATTFDVVLRGPRYAGGVIAPGVLTSAEDLFRRGARLAKVELRLPRKVIGKTTEENLQSGVLFGAASQIDGIIDRMKREIASRPIVVATGGLAPTLAPICKNLRTIDQELTVQGLRLLDERVRASRRRRKST